MVRRRRVKSITVYWQAGTNALADVRHWFGDFTLLLMISPSYWNPVREPLADGDMQRWCKLEKVCHCERGGRQGPLHTSRMPKGPHPVRSLRILRYACFNRWGLHQLLRVSGHDANRVGHNGRGWLRQARPLRSFELRELPFA